MWITHMQTHTHIYAHTHIHMHTHTCTHACTHRPHKIQQTSLGDSDSHTLADLMSYIHTETSQTQTSCHTHTHTDRIILGRLCGGLGVRREFRSFSKVPVDCDLFRWGCLQL
jgi:hypothetical protein